MALPVHTSRPPRLGCKRSAHARRPDLAGFAAQTTLAPESKRLLLHPRPHERQVPDGQTVLETDMGEGPRRQWPPDPRRQSRPFAGRQPAVPRACGRDKLDGDVLQPADKALLLSDTRGL